MSAAGERVDVSTISPLTPAFREADKLRLSPVETCRVLSEIAYQAAFLYKQKDARDFEQFQKTYTRLKRKIKDLKTMEEAQHLWALISKAAANVFRHKTQLGERKSAESRDVDVQFPPLGSAAPSREPSDALARPTMEKFYTAMYDVLLDDRNNLVASSARSKFIKVFKKLRIRSEGSWTITSSFIDTCAE